jgi:hypothetical protein
MKKSLLTMFNKMCKQFNNFGEMLLQGHSATELKFSGEERFGPVLHREPWHIAVLFSDISRIYTTNGAR